MKKRSLLIILSFILILVITSSMVNAFGGMVHKEIALDAYYYMEHRAEATANQRAAAVWMTSNWGIPGAAEEWKRKPWTIIAEGARAFDYLSNICFDNDEFFDIHYTSAFGHDYTSWTHFLDLASKYGNWAHSSHNNKTGGIHNDIDGYNYKRHEENLTPGYDFDKDDAVSTWMGNDDFCIVHSGYLLDIYERDQGGKDDNGVPISSSNHSCYTRWNYDFDNMIFAPIDNVGNHWYGKAVAFGANRYYGPYYLGYALHAVGDCGAFHHLCNSTGWGHTEFEDWANEWYAKRGESIWFNYAKVKTSIQTDFTKGGIAPANRDFKWLVNRLAALSYEYGRTRVWDRYTDKESFDASFDDYMQYVYPKAVACAVILMEKLYNLVQQNTTPQQAMVKLVITRVAAKDDPDGWGWADYYSKVNIGGQSFATNYVDDDDDISPNWTFTAAVSTTPIEVPIKIEIWDSDGGARGDDDHCDINGASGKKDLNLKLNLNTLKISGDLSGNAGALLYSVGGGDSDRTKIWFTIEKL